MPNYEEDMLKYHKTNLCFLVDISKHVSNCINEISASIKKFLNYYSRLHVDYFFDAEIITFGDKPQIIQEFQDVKTINVPVLSIEGEAHLCEALDLMFKTIEDKRTEPKLDDFVYHSPRLFVFSNGKIVDDDLEISKRAKDIERKFFKGRIEVFGVDDNPDIDLLRKVFGKAVAVKSLETYFSKL